MSAAAQLPADEGVSGSSSIAVGGEGAASASASGSAVEVLEPEAEAAPAMGKMGMCSRCDKEAAARYRCPGCEVVTCSLACTNEHKAALGCTGKRARTAFVDIHSLGDRHLISGAPRRQKEPPACAAREAARAAWALRDCAGRVQTPKRFSYTPRHKPVRGAGLGGRCHRWHHEQCRERTRAP
jgi:hypothetical protein